MQEKTCNGCGVALPATTEFFHRRRPEGPLRARCKSCTYAVRRLRRHDECSKRRAAWAANIDEAREQARIYRAGHCEEIAACKREYRRKSHGSVLAQERDYRKRHLEEVRERRRQYDSEHREEAKARSSRWKRENPERASEQSRATKARRRARMARSEGRCSTEDVAAQRTRQRGRCYWCGTKVGRHYHVDHVIPIVLGGSNGPENLVIACAHCNLSKGAKHPMEFAGRLC